MMALVLYKCAILLFTQIVSYISSCDGQEIKTTLLTSDLYDKNWKNNIDMRYRLLSDEDNTLIIGGKSELKTIFIKNYENTDDDMEVKNTVFGTCDPHNDIPCSRQKQQDACFNYIRVVNRMDNDTRMLVCGSNALYPRCYHVNFTVTDEDGIVIEGKDTSCPPNSGVFDKRIENGVDFTPFSWDGEMTHTFMGNEMFSGGSRSQNRESLICHIEMDEEGFPGDRVCTNTVTEFLNKAKFVGKPIHYQGHTYYFFREFAEEYINHGKIIYSRVGRICDNDSGGEELTTLTGKLISFIKARLDCSISGEYDPFFFNEIQDIYQSTKDPTIVYAVFTTPDVALQQSAVCRYSLKTIKRMMDTDMFKGQEQIDKNWQVITDLDNRPGICANPLPISGYERYWDVNLLYPDITNDYVLEPTSRSPIPTPLFILQDAVYTSIVVDDTSIPDKKVYILGTDNSTVFMAYENGEETKIFHKIDLKMSYQDADSVMDLIIHRYKDNTSFVYGTTNGRILGFQLANCGRYTQSYCQSNPYCAWNDDKLFCSPLGENLTLIEPSDEFEEFVSETYCDDGTTHLKFSQNSPTTCLKKEDSVCRFDFMATHNIDKPTNDSDLTCTANPSNFEIKQRIIITGLFKDKVQNYFTVEVKAARDMNCTFAVGSCSLNFTIEVDNSDEVGKNDNGFFNDMKEFNYGLEQYRYCLFRWPQEAATTCQSRITPQEKRGRSYFPRSNNYENMCRRFSVED